MNAVGIRAATLPSCLFLPERLDDGTRRNHKQRHGPTALLSRALEYGIDDFVGLFEGEGGHVGSPSVAGLYDVRCDFLLAYYLCSSVVICGFIALRVCVFFAPSP